MPEDLEDATKIILPGVGAFDYAMSQLNASGMREALEQTSSVRQDTGYWYLCWYADACTIK